MSFVSPNTKEFHVYCCYVNKIFIPITANLNLHSMLPKTKKKTLLKQTKKGTLNGFFIIRHFV